MTIQQKKEYAKILYTQLRLTQKEAAEKSGVSTKTINKWVNDEKWDDLRSSFIITKNQQLKRLYAQINEINTAIEKRPEGERYANSKEADTLVKLTAAASSLESETSIAETVTVFINFIEWLRTVELPKAQDFGNYMDDYIKTLCK